MDIDKVPQYWSDIALAAACCADDLCKDPLFDGGAGLSENNHFEANAVVERWMHWLIMRSMKVDVSKRHKVTEKQLARKGKQFSKSAAR